MPNAQLACRVQRASGSCHGSLVAAATLVEQEDLGYIAFIWSGYSETFLSSLSRTVAGSIRGRAC